MSNRSHNGKHVIVVGGGFSGVAAALQAAKEGAEVTLFERTDMLLGCGLRAGLMNQNARLTASLEAKAMGAGEIFQTLESLKISENIYIPGTENGYTYDVAKSESLIRRLLLSHNVQIRLETRIVNVVKEGKDRIRAVIDEKGNIYEAEAFIDATGTFGTIEECSTYGPGCVMCILRCPTYGDRVSIATIAGAEEVRRETIVDGKLYVGGRVASVCFYKDTLSVEIRKKLEEVGQVVSPLPQELVNYKILKIKASTAFDKRELAENIFLIDIGPVAKAFHLTYFPLERIRQIPGFEYSMIEHAQNPVKFGEAGFVRFLSMVKRDDYMRVNGFSNLFCAGEKSGPLHGVCDVTVTGILAGYNAAMFALDREMITLPRESIIGDFISFIREKMSEPITKSFSLGGGEYFHRAKELGLYLRDEIEVKEKIRKLGLLDFFRGIDS
jgi:hypothetical protein